MMSTCFQYFRKQLDNHNLRHVQIIAPDLIGIHAWDIFTHMLHDGDLADAIQVVG